MYQTRQRSPEADSLILKLDKVDFSYRVAGQNFPVLRQLDMSIDRGEMVAIQGPSGSGKSTLFYLIGCMLRPSAGQILFSGIDIASFDDLGLAEFRNQNVGFVFQQFHLLPRANVLQNILLPVQYPAETARESAADVARATDLARRLGLGDHLDKQPHQLSGGQQQRVAIARALMRDVDLILADEPTGNLDSKNAEEVLDLFQELNRQGKTIVLITHDSDVARRCHRVLHFKDGLIVRSERVGSHPVSIPNAASPSMLGNNDGLKWNDASMFLRSVPMVAANIIRNRTKSLLTMLGVIIGVASVLAMISLGQFTKRRILEGYESLGVNKVQIYGDRNWRLKPGESTSPNPFQSFSWEGDLLPLKKVFPEISLMSPLTGSWGVRASFGGKSATGDMQLFGVSEEYAAITNMSLSHGVAFSRANVERADKVCIVGAEFPKLFAVPAEQLLNSFIMVSIQERTSMPCRVIGISNSQRSNKEWLKPDKQILTPYTTHQSFSNVWDRRIGNVVITIDSAGAVEDAGKKITNFFKARYGNSGEFSVDSDSTLVAQMKRFLNIFAILLGSIAFLSLLVGGIGIHNMMLVSVADRLKEIGLRKAVGATARSLKVLFLTESLLLCMVAGVIGIGVGMGVCQLGIWAATQFMKDLKFEWVFEPVALVISVVAMVVVGVLSGLVPARKAEKLTVIEALRSE